MKINKSSRHSKITGNFAENLVLYLLSKSGFECANIDHTGIDIIARKPYTDEVMGISVKSRSRVEGKEGTSVTISKDNFDKIKKACEAFSCVPYFAVVVDEEGKIYCFILSMEKLLKIFSVGKTACDWKMNKKHIEQYYKDEEIKIFEFDYKDHHWWN